MNGTEAQQLFAFFFAVLYGGMLSAASGLRGFPWGFPAETDGKTVLVRRLVIAILMLNFTPFLLFACAFDALGSYSVSDIPFWWLILICAAALSAFAPYRVFHALMISLQGTRSALYKEAEYDAVVLARGIRKSWGGQLIGAAMYLAPLVLLLCIA